VPFRPVARADLESARAGQGPTAFDWLAEIFENQIPGRLRLMCGPDHSNACPRV